VKQSRGFTLLEMIVATTIMAIAVVGLMSGLASATRNAARLQDYDRAVQLARVRMNELLLDRTLPRNVRVEGMFDPAMAGGMEAGWQVQLTTFKMPPVVRVNDTALDRVELQIWWNSGTQKRTFTLDAFRPRVLTAADLADLPAGVAQ
jgi:general secretion pathway protein I